MPILGAVSYPLASAVSCFVPGTDSTMENHRNRGPQIALAAILLLYLVYAGAFIFRTSFVVEGIRHFCLFDDAMISMRYARNLADGHGPVWNPGGQRVEGYTNPLWMGTMAALHLLPIPGAKMSLPVQIISAGLLLANLLVIRKIARFLGGDSTLVWLGAVVLTAFYLPLNNWALQGMEVGASALIVSLGVWLAVRCIHDGRSSLPFYVLLAVGVLVRIDMLVPSAILCGWLAMADRGNRRRHCLAGLAVLGGGLALQSGFRVLYYGEWLPNTYYLKMTGYPAVLRIIRGGLVFWDFVRHMNWLLFLLPFTLLLFRRDKYVMLLVLLLGGQFAYSVYVGGDAWEWWGGANRYISIAMPLFFVLLCCAVETIAARLAGMVEDSDHPHARLLIRRPYFVVFFVVLALLGSNSLKGPRSLKQWALLERPMLVDDNKQMVQRARILRRVTRPEAKIALVWAGIIPYFADRQMLDIAGKNDPHIARLPMHRATEGPGYDYFLPGHLKWDYGYTIGQLHPDVTLQTHYPPGEAERFLDGRYREVELGGFKFHLRDRSPDVLWDRVAGFEQPGSERHVASTGK